MKILNHEKTESDDNQEGRGMTEKLQTSFCRHGAPVLFAKKVKLTFWLSGTMLNSDDFQVVHSSANDLISPSMKISSTVKSFPYSFTSRQLSKASGSSELTKLMTRNFLFARESSISSLSNRPIEVIPEDVSSYLQQKHVLSA